MNDKNIRKILIAYIKASTEKVRIYQEKSIGNSICDVMVVTDCLIGFEIKSDLDNYSRLPSQVRAYDRFFERNYLVVSDRHLQSAPSKVPEYWGIMCIRDSAVTIERKAKNNKKVSRRSQLSVLWKIEMKNLLIKNNLPLYAQREKGFIADKIVESVSSDILQPQIAQELMNRDYSVYDAEDYTIRSDKTESGNRDVVLNLVDELSEKNFEDFTLDQWIGMYQKAKRVQVKKEKIFKVPVERPPHKISYTDIEAVPGVPWIGQEIINDFVNQVLMEGWYSYKTVEYEPVTGNWFVREKRSLPTSAIAAITTYGTKRYNALYIMEAILNLREIKIYDNGNVYNEEETIAALEKQKVILNKFKEWIWEDVDRRWQVEEAYNNMFATLENPEFSGQELEFPDMDSKFQLYAYQKDAVQRIISTQNTLLAFDVGAGKTYIMIAAAMKLREMGIARKNLFVVPNNIVGQWEKIFTDLYPKAKVIAVEPKSFKPDMRKKVLEQIRDGDYDGIIMAYSCFEMIPLSVNQVMEQMNTRLHVLNTAVADLSQRNDYGCRAAVEREKTHIRKLTQEFIESMDIEINEITFDQLEINTLFLDEAHNYKNIPIRTRLKNLNGINTKGSVKCQDMMRKIRCIQETNGGRGAVLATGTPLCNSISDAYAMQMYLQYDKLSDMHLDIFDNWVKTFALPEQLCEIDVDTSKFRFVRRFSKFYNLPELSKLFSQIAVFHVMDSNDDLPILNGYTDIVIKKNKSLGEYMLGLCERTEKIRAKEVPRNTDNMLKVSIDGRKAALDLELVGAEQLKEEYTKVYQCAANVVKIYKQFEGSTQLVFCDYSTPKSEKFSVYEKLKQQCISSGIPKKEIAFIHSFHSESSKLELYRKVNEGKIRLLIGSTFKLGIGANVQTKLKAIHHLDVPWRPADMIQREGRILRRGNENSKVSIFRYIAEGSFDAYSWQILETKQKFISQFLSGSTYQRSISDLENNVLTYAEVKALALSTPLMKQFAEKENEMRTLMILSRNFVSTKEKNKKELEKLMERVPDMDAAAENLRYLSQFNNNDYSEAWKQNKELLSMSFLFGKGNLANTSVLGFRIILPVKQNEKKPYIYLERQKAKYYLEMSKSAQGNMRRIINFMKKFPAFCDELKLRKEKIEEQEQYIKDSLQEDNPYITQIAEYKEQIENIKKMISPAQ